MKLDAFGSLAIIYSVERVGDVRDAAPHIYDHEYAQASAVCAQAVSFESLMSNTHYLLSNS